jgi:hypothetical protein
MATLVDLPLLATACGEGGDSRQANDLTTIPLRMRAGQVTPRASAGVTEVMYATNPSIVEMSG